jgi:hypothetical protein
MSCANKTRKLPHLVACLVLTSLTPLVRLRITHTPCVIGRRPPCPTVGRFVQAASDSASGAVRSSHGSTARPTDPKLLPDVVGGPAAPWLQGENSVSRAF